MIKLRKAQLRDCAQAAVRQRYSWIEEKTGRGIIPGARLKGYTSNDSEPRQIAVRTSLDREVGLTRNPNGTWATIPRMDEVIVAVPSASDSTQAEVLSFDPKVIIEAFDAALALHTSRNKDLSPKAPIFVSLDKPRNPTRRVDATCGLSEKAQWRTLVPISGAHGRPQQPDGRPQQPESFVERVKRQFAELNGVDVSKVVVEFRILA